MPPASTMPRPKSAGPWRGSSGSKTATAAGARMARAISSITAATSERRARRRKRLWRWSGWWQRGGSGGPAAGEIDDPAVERGIDYLARTQDDDGFWSEPHYTATGFPRVFYLRYHGYPKFFPLWALARYRNLKNANSRSVRYGM